MNEELRNITDHTQLLQERARLQALIENQKNIVRHDLDELKAEFKKEIKPAIDAASFVKKLAKPETRNETIVTIGSNIALDLILKRMLRGSNLLVQLILPKIIKNYTTHFLHSFKKPTIQNIKTMRESEHSIDSRY